MLASLPLQQTWQPGHTTASTLRLGKQVQSRSLPCNTAINLYNTANRPSLKHRFGEERCRTVAFFPCSFFNQLEHKEFLEESWKSLWEQSKTVVEHGRHRGQRKQMLQRQQGPDSLEPTLPTRDKTALPNLVMPVGWISYCGLHYALAH